MFADLKVEKAILENKGKTWYYRREETRKPSTSINLYLSNEWGYVVEGFMQEALRNRIALLLVQDWAN